MLYWDRTVLKERAKIILRQRYWLTFGAVLVAQLLGAGGFAPSFRINVNIGGNEVSFPQMPADVADADMLFSRYEPLMIFGVIFAALLVIAVSVFVASAMEVGLCRFLWHNQRQAPPFSTLFSGFQKGYLNTVKTIFLRNLYVFLWSLLFIIPGIIKSYSYFMVPYLLAENPDMPAERAFEISKRTTDGEKGEMFVLVLSFFGWSLLGVLTCGVGLLFLAPYVQTTYAELYGALRYKAIATGICTEWELAAH